MICCRKNTLMDWDAVCIRLGEILRLARPLVWQHVDPLRCVLLPEADGIATKLINLRQVLIRNTERVELNKWKHWKIVIRGLPLHLWSVGFFRAIRGLCSGFLKVDEETWKSYEIARIWSSAGNLEKIPCVIFLFDKGKEFSLFLEIEMSEMKHQTWPTAGKTIIGAAKHIQIQNSDRIEVVVCVKQHPGTIFRMTNDMAQAKEISGKGIGVQRRKKGEEGSWGDLIETYPQKNG